MIIAQVARKKNNKKEAEPHKLRFFYSSNHLSSIATAIPATKNPSAIHAFITDTR